jgi:hypothetical protein
MSDVDLIEETNSLIPVYVDGFGEFRVMNGVLRCTGFQLSAGQFPGSGPARTAVVKLIISIAGADQAQLETQRVLREGPTKGIQIWRGESASH